MMGNGPMEKEMVMEYNNGLMEVCIKVNESTTKLVDMAK